jgi:alpha-beta hydrolase superfamily lysophospholipase
MPERISFKTIDDVEIVGDWVTAPTTIGAVILLPMMPVTRQIWGAFQRTLARRGLASLAIDLRGHGESIRGPEGVTLDYKKFSEDEHRSSLQDVRGAYDWLRARGIESARIVVVGASIGANLALQFLTDEPELSAVAMLSPGDDYHGVTTLDIAEQVLPHQSVWMAASAGDDDDSMRTVDVLSNIFVVDQKVVEKLRGAGHGTKMLDTDVALAERLADWLRDRVLAVH